jgi:hypothetical protein
MSENHKGWLELADKKTNLVTELQNAELELQTILKDTLSISEREDNAAKYKKKHSELKEKRLSFTRDIEQRLFAPLMEFEKRTDPKVDAKFIAYEKNTLDLKLEDENKAREAKQKADEISRFETHLRNEYERIAADFRIAVYKELTTMYNHFIEAKIENPNVQDVITAVNSIKLSEVAKFPPVFNTREAFLEIYKKVPKVDWFELLKEANTTVTEKFAMYEHDLKANVKVDEAEAIAKIEQEKSERQAVNTLLAEATTVTFVSEGKPIKRMLDVVVEESPAFAKTVIANFLKYSASWEYLSNRKWSTLTVAQMAAALGKYMTETGDVIDGLKTKEVVK